MTEQAAKGVIRRLTVSIVAIVLLTAALTVTTFILVVSTVSTSGHPFSTGSVTLNLNDGKPIVSAGECTFAPGQSMERSFTVENLSTCAVWYKIYFSNVSGEMADAVDVEIRDGDKVLASGKLNDLTEENTAAYEDALDIDGKKTLTVRFHFDENAGGALQNALLSFDFSARATQVPNNPDKKFH